MTRAVLNRRAVLALGAGAGLAAASRAGMAQSAKVPDVVRIGILTAPRAWVLGKQDGTYEKALGTKVEWVPFPAGGPALSLLAAKQIDFAIFGSTPIVAGLTRKLPIQVLGSPEIVATSERLIAKPGIADLKGLEGKKIAVAPSSTMAFALEALIKTNKLNGASISRLPLNQPETIAAWKRGDIDATYINGPFWSELLADGGRQLLVSRDLQSQGYFFWNSAVVRTEFAEQFPETVVRWLQTVQGVVERYKKDPDEASRLLAKDFGAPFEAVRDTLAGLGYPSFQEQLGPTYWGDGRDENAPLLKALAGTAAFLAETGEIRRDAVPASFTSSVNYGLLKRAFPA